MKNKITDYEKFLIKEIKIKRKNATIFPAFKKTLIMEKTRLRSLELSNPFTDLISTLKETEYYELICNNKRFKSVVNKSEIDHYILGKITIQDKMEYYLLMDYILYKIKNNIKEKQK